MKKSFEQLSPVKPTYCTFEALTQHLQTTITKRKPFQCKLCQKRFKTEPDLTQHTGKCKQGPDKKNSTNNENTQILKIKEKKTLKSHKTSIFLKTHQF